MHYNLPYTTLKENPKNYKIMLYREQYGLEKTAARFNLSKKRLTEIYDQMKWLQAQLYAGHMAVVLGHESADIMFTILKYVNHCYQNYTYTAAYFEKTYPDVLAEYRNGEPGMSQEFLQKLPPFHYALPEEIIYIIVDMKDKKGLPFEKIADCFQLTPEKVKYEYHSFYHKMVCETILRMGDARPFRLQTLWQHYVGDRNDMKSVYDSLRRDIENNSVYRGSIF